MIDESLFKYYTVDPLFEVHFNVEGCIVYHIKANSLEEADTKAKELAQCADFDECELYKTYTARVGSVVPLPTKLYFIVRGKIATTTYYLEDGDVPREPNTGLEKYRYEQTQREEKSNEH